MFLWIYWCWRTIWTRELLKKYSCVSWIYAKFNLHLFYILLLHVFVEKFIQIYMNTGLRACILNKSSWKYASWHCIINHVKSSILCSIPFSVDDISKSMEQIDIADIEPPPLIRENSGFSFLLPRPDWELLM